MESLKNWYREGDPKKQVPVYVVGAFGAFAGACSVFGNTPIDVIKTRLQVSNYTSTLFYSQNVYNLNDHIFYKHLVFRLIIIGTNLFFGFVGS